VCTRKEKKRRKGEERVCNMYEHNVCICIQKKSTSLDGGIMNPVKERDKNCKRKSYLNRSRHVEAAPIDHLSEGKEFINGKKIYRYKLQEKSLFEVLNKI
jgi:hypothetical protein